MLLSWQNARLVLALAGVASLVGCPADEDGDNQLPSASNSDDTSTTDDDATQTETGETGFPAAYRFSCVDIQGIGDGDGDVLQAQVLENTWSSDIDNFKLNIMLEVLSREESTGEMAIRSGIGTNPSDMCSEPTSESELIDVTFDAAANTFGPNVGGGECITDGSDGAGTYSIALGADFTAYIYAQDDTEVTFNCTPDAATPDAVPIRAIEAEITASSNEQQLSGRLVGCLGQAAAMSLCSCLGQCTGAETPDDLQTEGVCAGCPIGGVTLDQLLGAIDPSQRCSDILGEPAFDLTIGFVADRLPNVPTTCG